MLEAGAVCSSRRPLRHLQESALVKEDVLTSRRSVCSGITRAVISRAVTSQLTQTARLRI